MTKIDVSDRRRIPKHGAVTQVGGWRPRRRRWVRGLAAGFVGVLVLTFSLYGWAWSSVDHSSIARAMWWMEADVDDQYRFPARAIRAGEGCEFASRRGRDRLCPTSRPCGRRRRFRCVPARDGHPRVRRRRRGPVGLRTVLRRVGPHDAPDLVLGREVVRVHARGHRHRRGVDRGCRRSGDRVPPRTDAAGPAVRSHHAPGPAHDVLGAPVRGALRSPFPWGDDIETYYGTDLREIALDHTEIERPPGQQWLYNNYNPLLLGMVLERATGMSVAAYMTTRLWQPSGLNATPPGTSTRRDPASRRWRVA